MGQALSDALGDSPPPHDTLDPGPLSDAELAEALKRFAEHATDGALAQGAFDAIAENKQDDFAAAARHASFYDAARRGAPTVDARAFVAFCGVATRGSRSRRLEHVVTAGLGVRTLSDACDAAQTKRLAALMFSLVGAEPSPAVERALSMYEDAGACARWCDRNAPGLADAYAAWARRRFLDDARPAPTIPAASGLLAPASVRACLLLSDVRTYGGLLRPLYASSKDGWSFQRLCREILGWAGPTLLVARAGARTFGVLADEAWRDDRKPFGAGGCRLYTFAPAFAVARPRAGQSQDLLHLNTQGSASVPKGLISGDGAVHVPTELGDARIKVGRSRRSRVWLSSTTRRCAATAGGWTSTSWRSGPPATRAPSSGGAGPRPGPGPARGPHRPGAQGRQGQVPDRVRPGDAPREDVQHGRGPGEDVVVVYTCFFLCATRCCRWAACYCYGARIVYCYEGKE